MTLRVSGCSFGGGGGGGGGENVTDYFPCSRVRQLTLDAHKIRVRRWAHKERVPIFSFGLQPNKESMGFCQKSMGFKRQKSMEFCKRSMGFC